MALEEFAAAGYVGASLQSIADRAGVSKASVLYHFSSKAALLDAALSPAIEAIGELLPATLKADATDRLSFVAAFVDLLLEHRLAAQVFITQSGTLTDVPVIQRAQEFIRMIAEARPEQSLDHRVRFAVALGGAAYLLAQAGSLGADGAPDDDELRSSLIRIVGELLAPVPE